MNSMGVEKHHGSCGQGQRYGIMLIKTAGVGKETTKLAAVSGTGQAALAVAAIDNPQAAIGFRGIIESYVNIWQLINMVTVMNPVG